MTCIALDTDESCLVTGSRDSSVMVWDLFISSSKVSLQSVPRLQLFGHDDEVTAVAVNADIDVILSASADNTCILHSFCSGDYIRTIRPQGCGRLSKVSISPQGDWAIYDSLNAALHLFTLNGTELRRVNLGYNLMAMTFAPVSEIIVIGGDNHAIEIRDSFT